MTEIATLPRDATALEVSLRYGDPDLSVEPQWVSERLFAVEAFDGRIWDPAAGLGRIVAAAEAAGHVAVASDSANRGLYPHIRPEFVEQDFLLARNWGKPFDNIVCHPPHTRAEEFVRHALDLAARKVAMLLPAWWIERSPGLLETTPLRRVHIVESWEQYGSCFAWFVWLRGYDGPPELAWLRRGHASDCRPNIDIERREP